MKIKIFISSLFLVLTISGFAQFEAAKQTYSAPNLKSEIQKQKTVAILPFDVAITYKRIPKHYDSSANKNEEKSLTTNLQSSMFTYLLRKADKYSVTFQDPTRTNALLKSKGVYDNLDLLTQDSICKILGVDAVIKCNYEYEKTASEGGAIAKTILFGSMGSKTGSGALTMQIYNGSDGNLLWRFYKAMNDDVMSSTDQLITRMMKKVSRNFPYEK
ncbi:MAG: hypothetical protein ABI267_09530 [Ginsengibacter sp.]